MIYRDIKGITRNADGVAGNHVKYEERVKTPKHVYRYADIDTGAGGTLF